MHCFTMGERMPYPMPENCQSYFTPGTDTSMTSQQYHHQQQFQPQQQQDGHSQYYSAPYPQLQQQLQQEPQAQFYTAYTTAASLTTSGRNPSFGEIYRRQSSSSSAHSSKSLRYHSSSLGSSFGSSFGSTTDEDDVTSGGKMATTMAATTTTVGTSFAALSGDVSSPKKDDKRSTKGASKQRRDLINYEVSKLRDLLPLSEAARQRLSQLQIMSLACVFVRKSNHLSQIVGKSDLSRGCSSTDFLQCLHGFLLVLSKEGKLLYISENVTEFLGHSMVDMLTQGDSIYDIVDKKDHSEVKKQLTVSTEQEKEKSFFARMAVSRSFRRQTGYGDQKVMHIKGHFIQSTDECYGGQPIFFAICSPLLTPDAKEIAVSSSEIFQSVHSLDMRFLDLDDNGEFQMGYKQSEIYQRSWYSMVHPEDLTEAKNKHTKLIKSTHEVGSVMTLRLQLKSGEFGLFYVAMTIRPTMASNDPNIVCFNHRINDEDAVKYKQQAELYNYNFGARNENFLDIKREQSDFQDCSGFKSVATTSGKLQTTTTTSTQQQQKFYRNPQVYDVKKSPTQFQQTNVGLRRQDILAAVKRKSSLGASCHGAAKRMRCSSGGSDVSDSGNSLQNGDFSSIGGVYEASGHFGSGLQTVDNTLCDTLLSLSTPAFYGVSSDVKERVKNEKISIIEPIRGPTTPLTPESLRSESPQSKTSVFQPLTNPCPALQADYAIVPAAILTPDASPQPLSEEPGAKSMYCSEATPAVKKQISLPQLQIDVVDDYFSELDTKPHSDVTNPLKMERTQQPEVASIASNLADTLINLAQNGGNMAAQLTAGFMVVPAVTSGSSCPFSPAISSSTDETPSLGDELELSSNFGDFPIFEDLFRRDSSNIVTDDDFLMQTL